MTLLSSLALCAVLTAAPAAGTEPEQAAPPAANQPAITSADRQKSEAALKKADEALARNDIPAALAATSEAIRLDPMDPAIRLRRVDILIRWRGNGKSTADNQRIEDQLHADLQTLISADPQSTAAGVARGDLATLAGGTPPGTTISGCTAPEFSAAEELFGARRFQEAIAQYERASTRCPDDAVVWIDYGDAYFALRNPQKAQHLYETAIAKSPWNAQAHRFLADALGWQQEVAASYHEAVLAVVSDPTYAAAWGFLRSTIQARHGTWSRVEATKPKVERDPATHQMNVEVDTKSGDALWLAYGLSKAADFNASAAPESDSSTGHSTSQGEGAASGLAAERSAVRTVLDMRREQGSDSDFWSMMARADATGFLDEAIFLHLADRDLLTEYPAFRAAHHERLVQYVETVLAPLPTE